MQPAKITLLLIMLLSSMTLCWAQGKPPLPPSSREVLSLDFGWLFHTGDIPYRDFRANGDEAEGGSKGASAWGAASPGYNDSTWSKVNLPHDWVVEQPFDQTAVRNQGYRQRGIAWYRRKFKLPEGDRGKRLELQFDGVSTHCTVWFNGSLVHRNFNGYTTFTIDVTDLVRYGGAVNTIALRNDAVAMEGWWYEGGGIYRHTWLIKKPPVSIATDGVYANPIKSPEGRWSVPVKVELENDRDSASEAAIELTLLDPQGRKAGSAKAKAKIGPKSRAESSLTISVKNPELWSVEKPSLYTLIARSIEGGQSDEMTVNCGFRTLLFDAKEGFFLNEKPLKIKGACCHQDHAGVGVAVPDSLLEFRIRKLKEMGANAYRSAHNPPSKELLDLCDKMGMLVMDETRHFDGSAERLKELEWLVKRDRNHPSIILWSLFNEENALQGTEQGRAIVRRMMAAVRRLDSTRPITGAQNGGQLIDGKLNPNSVAHDLDVVGINYQVDLYQKIREAYPNKPIISSEDTSQVMTRGVFSTDWQKLMLTSYDEKYPGWASDNRGAWEAIARQPSFAGGFIWTGFDYRGEPSPFGWPAVSSYFGCMDLCGFPKTAFYLRQALWTSDRPTLTLIPHWNWQGREGEPIRVMAITNAESVTLFLNGKSLGEKKVDPFRMVEWQVPYAPGLLEAAGSVGGKVTSKFSVETTGPAVALRLTPDRKAASGDGCDAVPVTVEAVDAQGRAVPTVNLMVEFEISGPGEIIGLGNGDQTSHEPEKGSRISLFNGLAQVIVQTAKEGSGVMKLTAKAQGLSSATASLGVKSVKPIPAEDPA